MEKIKPWCFYKEMECKFTVFCNISYLTDANGSVEIEIRVEIEILSNIQR